MITALLYSGQHISGGHYNPLISIGLLIFEILKPIFIPGVFGHSVYSNNSNNNNNNSTSSYSRVESNSNNTNSNNSNNNAIDNNNNIHTSGGSGGSGDMNSSKCMIYITAQMLGVISAVCIGAIIKGNFSSLNTLNTHAHTNNNPSDDISVCVAEALFSFVLTMLVTTQCNSNIYSTMYIPNSCIYGLSMGCITLTSNLTIGCISNSILNPVYTVVIVVIHGYEYSEYIIWVYIIGQGIGCLLASFVFCLWYDPIYI